MVESGFFGEWFFLESAQKFIQTTYTVTKNNQTTYKKIIKQLTKKIIKQLTKKL